jgi:hypothetical protein
MDKRVRFLLLALLFLCCCKPGLADSRFDLIGPKIDVRVTRAGQTLPIAAVPNLQPGDKLWIHPDLPPSQSVHYLLICVFLRGNTNPPPEDWFFRIETWEKSVRDEGAFVTVPADAQQALMFLAPETGGDFKTLKSAVRGRPGAFVRASQDLIEAGFEEARIEKYIASIRRVPPADSALLLKHSDLLSRTLNLKPNDACFKQPIDMQFTCLTQSGSQMVLDDGNAQTIANVLNGPTSDLISQASYSSAAGGGLYSAYVGAIVDVVRIMSNLHNAQYQYIPAISFPQDDAMNLRLNTPPSFHNPKSVLVIALPAVQPAVTPPLRPADPNEITCLIKPTVVLPVDGAPLVFSADFAHDLVLHLNTPPGAPSEPDIPLTPDAYYGGLVLQKDQQHHIPLHDPTPLLPASAGHAEPNPFANPTAAPHSTEPPPKPQPKPVLLSGVILGRWGFDTFTGPTVQLQQLPGADWTILSSSAAGKEPTYDLIAGHTATLLLNSTGSACIHTITANPGGQTPFPVAFNRQPKPEQPNLLALTLPLERNLTPGDLHLAIQQYEQPKPDELAAHTYSEPATVSRIELHASDKALVVTGTRLGLIEKITVGDLTFSPAPDASYDTQPEDSAVAGTLHFAMAPNVPVPSTHVGENLTASIALRDSRILSVPLTVSASRPAIALLRKSALADAKSTIINLSNPDDLPLSSMLTFTLKSPDRFPRNGEIEIETLDGTLRTILTLAPSGGLLLQDPHTIVATLDPLRSFGPSAFGALRMRAMYPAAASHQKDRRAPSDTPAAPDASAASAQAGTSASTPDTDVDDASSPASDWLPLVTLVRLPTLTLLQCPPDATQSCTVTGNNFFLLQSISANPDSSDPVPVPDGYTGTSLTIPHPTAATIFFKLRDDPASIDSAILPTPAPPVTAHVHHVPHSMHSDTEPASQEDPAPATPGSAAPGSTVPETTTPTPAPPTQPTPTPQKPESPALQAPSSPSTTSPSVS